MNKIEWECLGSSNLLGIPEMLAKQGWVWEEELKKRLCELYKTMRWN